MRFYNKYRNGIYNEAEYSMPVIAKYGTGGGNTPLVLELVMATGQANAEIIRGEGAYID